jgi:hypothetical protein
MAQRPRIGISRYLVTTDFAGSQGGPQTKLPCTENSKLTIDRKSSQREKYYFSLSERLKLVRFKA